MTIIKVSGLETIDVHGKIKLPHIGSRKGYIPKKLGVSPPIYEEEVIEQLKGIQKEAYLEGVSTAVSNIGKTKQLLPTQDILLTVKQKGYLKPPKITHYPAHYPHKLYTGGEELPSSIVIIPHKGPEEKKEDRSPPLSPPIRGRTRRLTREEKIEDELEERDRENILKQQEKEYETATTKLTKADYERGERSYLQYQVDSGEIIIKSKQEFDEEIERRAAKLYKNYLERTKEGTKEGERVYKSKTPSKSEAIESGVFGTYAHPIPKGPPKIKTPLTSTIEPSVKLDPKLSSQIQSTEREQQRLENKYNKPQIESNLTQGQIKLITKINSGEQLNYIDKMSIASLKDNPQTQIYYDFVITNERREDIGLSSLTYEQFKKDYNKPKETKEQKRSTGKETKEQKESTGKEKKEQPKTQGTTSPKEATTTKTASSPTSPQSIKEKPLSGEITFNYKQVGKKAVSSGIIKFKNEEELNQIFKQNPYGTIRGFAVSSLEKIKRDRKDNILTYSRYGKPVTKESTKTVGSTRPMVHVGDIDYVINYK